MTNNFEEALVYAVRLHREQRRKGSGVPYISHLLAVCATVLEQGGGETEAIAALLHDAVEDQGGNATRQQIRQRFGEDVAAIVDACTDTDQQPKPPWRERKEAYLAHLPSAPAEVLLVSASDKLHNLRSIVSDYRRVGEQLWARFKGGKEGTLWYYRELITIFDQVGPVPLALELASTLSQLDQLMASGDA